MYLCDNSANKIWCELLVRYSLNQNIRLTLTNVVITIRFQPMHCIVYLHTENLNTNFVKVY